MDQGDDGDGQTANADYSIRIAAGIGAFTRDEWDGFAGTTRGDTENGYNPLVSFAFLSALEESGCAVRRTGWQGHHLRLETADGRLLGAVPCYLKSHSQGEYVFDHGWSDAFERAGGRYYPKLQCAVPFTPVTGPRLLIRNDVDREQIGSALASGLIALCSVSKASSAHVTFAREAESKFLVEHGFLQRTDQQFHWHNQDFAT